MRFLPLLGVTVALVAGTPSSSASARRPVPVGVVFWDAQHGLAALTTFATCRGFPPAERIALQRTTDGGATWKPVRTACASVTAFGGSVTLATAGREDALLALPGGLLRTSDGGLTWSAERAPRIVALSFASSSLGWAVVGDPQHLSVQETRDGG